MVGAKPPQVPLAGVDLGLQVVDQCQRGGHAASPRLGQVKPGQQLAAAAAEQVTGRAGLAERQQGRVDAVLQTGAVADQVQPEAGPLPLSPYPGGRQPDLGHQVTSGQLGQHAGVDPVSLARQQRQSLDLGRIRDRDLPAAKLQLVVDDPRAVHRLDRRPHRLAVGGGLAGKPTQSIGVGWRLDDLDSAALLVQQAHVQPRAGQIQPCVQHCHRPPRGDFAW
jgi:hypothetical protein